MFPPCFIGRSRARPGLRDPGHVTVTEAGQFSTRRIFTDDQNVLSFAALDRATAYPRCTSAEVYDYHDELTGVLASSLAKLVPAYTSLGFPESANSPTRQAPTRRPRSDRAARITRRRRTIGFAIVNRRG